jgi:thiamine transport system permease protein
MCCGLCPLGLLQAGWLVIMAHVVLALPSVSRQLAFGTRPVSADICHCCRHPGASPWRQWWSVSLPLLRRALVAAGLFAFAVSLGDFAAALLLSRPDTPTAPLFLARLLGRPGAMNYAMAAALAVVLVLVCVLVMIIAAVLTSPRSTVK